MANTYIQINLHLIFAVKYRINMIPLTRLPEIYSYMAKSISKRGHHTLKIGGTSNHVHILFNFNGKEPIPDIVRDLKTFSSKIINEKHIVNGHFEWQKGYACFSVSARDIEVISDYIDRQIEHHHGRGVRDELKVILQRAGISYDEKYLFTDD